MATVRREIEITAAPAEVWAALRDWGALHERLVPGFVVDTEVDGEDRIVTFFNGAVLREAIVDVDDERRRLAWSIVDGAYSHHNASAQVLDAGEGRARFVWIADLLPHDLAGRTGDLMSIGIAAVKQTMEGRVPA